MRSRSPYRCAWSTTLPVKTVVPATRSILHPLKSGGEAVVQLAANDEPVVRVLHRDLHIGGADVTHEKVSVRPRRAVHLGEVVVR